MGQEYTQDDLTAEQLAALLESSLEATFGYLATIIDNTSNEDLKNDLLSLVNHSGAGK